MTMRKIGVSDDAIDAVASRHTRWRGRCACRWRGGPSSSACRPCRPVRAGGGSGGRTKQGRENHTKWNFEFGNYISERNGNLGSTRNGETPMAAWKKASLRRRGVQYYKFFCLAIIDFPVALSMYAVVHDLRSVAGGSGGGHHCLGMANWNAGIMKQKAFLGEMGKSIVPIFF